jgi:queuosine precursor transporter
MQKKIEEHLKVPAERLYFILSGIFIASLITSNLIFQKFFTWDFFGIYTFEISAGIIPYPVTFLVTDIISEIYGKRRASEVVLSGLVASLFVLAIVMIADNTAATLWSPVNNNLFSKVFGLTGVAVGASMMAYLAAQFIDIRVFHFWKKLTKGKHLWLRNNASTITSQFIDTSAVLILLCLAGAIGWNRFPDLLLNGFLFKILIALIDTPVIYLATYSLRNRFQLELGEEMEY